jgi:hypothetical protein
MVSSEEGQSLSEFFLILPILIFLFIGVMELGVAMFTYLVVATAGREGARFAARGEFTGEEIAYRVLVAIKPLPVNPDNTQIIVTCVEIDATGNYTISEPSYFTGEIAPDGEVTIIPLFPPTDTVKSTRIDYSIFEELAEQNEEFNQDLPPGTPPSENNLVAVEAFYEHEQLFGLPIMSEIFPNPFELYFSSIMRVTRGARWD